MILIENKGPNKLRGMDFYKPTSSARWMRGMDLPATHDAWRRGAVAGSGARGACGGLFKALMEL